MSFLPAWKYQLDGMKWPLIIFYIVIAALLILVGVSTALATQQHTQFSVGGLEMASVVFIFIVGLNSFKSTFPYAQYKRCIQKDDVCELPGHIGSCGNSHGADRHCIQHADEVCKQL